MFFFIVNLSTYIYIYKHFVFGTSLYLKFLLAFWLSEENQFQLKLYEILINFYIIPSEYACILF